MSAPIFRREYWIEQLKKEVGLSDVDYNDLQEHFVYFGMFGDDAISKNAKTYVDEQLEIIEKQYAEIDVDSCDQQEYSVPEFDISSVYDKLSMLSDSLSEVVLPTEIPYEMNEAESVVQLKLSNQTIETKDVKYFEVLIGTRLYVVVINDHGDLKIKDQIRHIVNTSFFVEQRTPEHVYNASDTNHIISYYQFVNLIQPYLNMNTVPSASNKISQGVQTDFDGFKLDNF